MLPFVQKILNKAIYNCSFVSLSSMLTIFGIQVNNDIIDRSHDFGCHGDHFGRKICYQSYQNGYIIKLSDAGIIQGVQYSVIHHCKADPFTIPIVFGEY